MAGSVQWLRTSAALSIGASLLAGCAATTTAPAAVPTSFTKGVQTAEQDAGSRGDRRSVRRAVVAALTDENRAFVVPRSLRGVPVAGVLAVLTSPAETRARARRFERERSAASAGALQKAVLFVARQDFGPSRTGTVSRTAFLDREVWASSTFHVDRWQGVRVTGDTARVLVRGEDRGTDWDGDPKRDAWAQIKLILHRDPTAANGWRLLHEQAASTAA